MGAAYGPRGACESAQASPRITSSGGISGLESTRVHCIDVRYSAVGDAALRGGCGAFDLAADLASGRLDRPRPRVVAESTRAVRHRAGSRRSKRVQELNRRRAGVQRSRCCRRRGSPDRRHGPWRPARAPCARQPALSPTARVSHPCSAPIESMARGIRVKALHVARRNPRPLILRFAATADRRRIEEF